MPDYPEYEGVYGGENDEDYREHCRIAQQCHDEASKAWSDYLDVLYKEDYILDERATLKPSDKKRMALKRRKAAKKEKKKKKKKENRSKNDKNRSKNDKNRSKNKKSRSKNEKSRSKTRSRNSGKKN